MSKYNRLLNCRKCDICRTPYIKLMQLNITKFIICKKCYQEHVIKGSKPNSKQGGTGRAIYRSPFEIRMIKIAYKAKIPLPEISKRFNIEKSNILKLIKGQWYVKRKRRNARSNEEIIEIRRKYEAGIPLDKISKQHNIKKPNIFKLLNGERYKIIEEDDYEM